MDPLTVLNSIQIASPCPASWEDMQGDGRARFCLDCQKRVYDLSTLSAADAVALIERNEGSLCVRLYRRQDGTVLTADCPVGLRARAAAKIRRVGAGATAVAAFLLTGTLLKARMDGNPSGPTPPPVAWAAPPSTISEWFREIFGLRKPVPAACTVLMGDIALPPPPISPPTGAPASLGVVPPSDDREGSDAETSPEGGTADGPADHPE